ncbi:MAG: hypothetical protein D6766_01795 [Verrucomicrobia bacterium]|nr:MAG: hypothetical protein D6766_01795 [Verrucomicrobiota bacterium]
MFRAQDTGDPTAVAHEVQLVYCSLFPEADRRFIPRAFGVVIDSFCGGNPAYLPIDARYHDVEHTMQGALCMARLLERRHRLGAEPVLTEEQFRLGLLAMLMHDTGYLKHAGDTEGTGAKYTAIHVRRSAEFAANCLAARGYTDEEITAVQHMIQCTGLGADPRRIPFKHAWERMLGCALATADLLGQMAAPDYVDKLPILYEEFAEAAAFTGGQLPTATTFDSAEELIRRTPEFWENYVRPRLDNELERLYRFLNDPWPDGPNPYVQAIEANIRRIRNGAFPALAAPGANRTRSEN